MSNVLPLTPGLLISMSVRNDHSFGMGDALGFFRANPRPLHETQIKTIDTSYAEYVEAYHGRYCQGQRLEECTGTGFYRPDLEERYTGSADPIALRHAEKLVDQFNKLIGLIPDHPEQA